MRLGSWRGILPLSILIALAAPQAARAQRPPGAAYTSALQHPFVAPAARWTGTRGKRGPILGTETPQFFASGDTVRPQAAGPNPDTDITPTAAETVETEAYADPIPSSGRIAFVSNGKDEWVNNFDPETGKVHEPDGQIDVAACIGDGSSPISTSGYNVWLMRYDGAEQVQFTNMSGDEHDPTFDPGGKVVTFANNRTGTYQLYSAPINNPPAVTQLTFSPGNKRHPTYSADGNYIAYASDETGNWDIFVMRADGRGTPSVLTTSTLDDTEPAWSPDGLAILYTAQNTSGGSNIYSITNALAAPTRTKLTDGNGSATVIDRDPAWRRDGTGTAFAFASNRRTSGADLTTDFNIWVVARAGELGAGLSSLFTNNDPTDTYDDTDPTWSPALTPSTPAPSRLPTRLFWTSLRPNPPDRMTSNADIWELLVSDDRPAELLALPSVSNRNPSPGSTITVYAQPYDKDTGVQAVTAFFKDPDGPEDDAQGRDHKIFLAMGVAFEPNGAAPGTFYMEYDCDTIGSTQLFDDGNMSLHGDQTAGDGIYSGKWTTPTVASDFLIDVMVMDNSATGNPFTYDNVYGLSTVLFSPHTGVLLVDDYCEGQKFIFDSGTNNDQSFGFPVESYFCRNESAADTTFPAFNTFRGPGPGETSDEPVYGEPHDLWRVICRGAPDDRTLTFYTPSTEVQLTTSGEEGRIVPVADRCVWWASPHTGGQWVADGTIQDATTQATLSNFVARGGRLCVSGQDVAYALTLDGKVSNNFLGSVLGAGYVRDDNQGTPWDAVPFWNVVGVAGDPVADDPWPSSQGPFVHWLDTFHNPPVLDPPTTDVGFWTDPNGIFNDSAQWSWYPDVCQPRGSIQMYGYGAANAADGAGFRKEDATTGSRVVYFAFPFEAIHRRYHTSPLHCREKRAKVRHNTLCYLRTGALQGRVVNIDGGGPITDPEPIVWVMQYPTNTPLWAQRCAPDGTWVINGIAPGQYTLRVTRPGFLTLDRADFNVVHGGFRVNVTDFALTQAVPGAITGTVTDATAGTPIANVTITGVSVDDPAVKIGPVETGTDGVYTIANVAAGDWDVTADGSTATPPYGSDGPYTVTVDPGSPTTQDFALKAGDGTVIATVTDATTAHPLENATVRIRQGTTLVRSGITDANGQVSINVSPGSYTVTAECGGFATSAGATVTVQAGVTTSIAIALTPVAPGNITGKVYRGQNTDQPMGGVTITATVSGRTFTTTTAAAYTFPGGNAAPYNYRLTGIPAGTTVTVTPTLANHTASPAQRSVTVSSNLTTENVNFSILALHTFSSGLQLVSFPYDYSLQTPNEVLGLSAGATPHIAVWDPTLAQYKYYPQAPADRFRLGGGYWLGLDQTSDVPLQGLAAPSPYTWSAEKGWNQIGTPFPTATDFYGLQVTDHTGVTRNIQDAFTAGILRNALFGFAAGGYRLVSVMQPWSGYWVLANEEFSFVATNPASAASAAQAVTAAEARPALTKPTKGWVAPLLIEVAGMQDSATAFGAAPEDQVRALSIAKPPLPQGPFVYATTGTADGISKDMAVQYVPLGAKQTWNLSVQTSARRSKVTVRWPDLSGLPPEVRPVLVDPATGDRTYMRVATSYHFTSGTDGAPRNLQIIADQGAGGALVVDGVVVQQLRGHGVTIAYTLARDATVVVEVMNIAGRAIAQPLPGRAQGAGLNTVNWNGTTLHGVRPPQGMYMVRITARAEDGREVSTVRTFELR